MFVELVEADRRPLHQPDVYTELVTVGTRLVVLGHQGANRGLKGGVKPASVVVARIAQAEPDGRLGKQGQVEIAHLASDVLQVRTIRIPRHGRRVKATGVDFERGADALIQIQRVRKQVEVEEVLVTPVEADEVVQLVLLEPQAADIVRVATESETAQVQIVEEASHVRNRAHRQLLPEKTRTTLQVNQRVIQLMVAVDVRDAAAELD